MALSWDSSYSNVYNFSSPTILGTEALKPEDIDVKILKGLDESVVHIVLETFDGFKKVLTLSPCDPYDSYLNAPYLSWFLNNEIVIFRRVGQYIYKQDLPAGVDLSAKENKQGK